MPTITVKTTKVSKHLCGFCSTGGRHDLCPGGILNGNQTEVLVCPCPCDTPKIKCINCNARQDVSPETWTCLDAEECANKVEARRRRAEEEYGKYARAVTERKAENAPEKPAKAPAKPKGGQCLCCGEATKGGLFLPGHDARYLARTVTEVKEGASLDDTMTAWARAGISEALQAKLVKRLGAA